MEEKKFISAQDVDIVSASDPRTLNGTVQRNLAYLSKKLDLDYSYIYAMYSELFPGISPVAFLDDKALGYVASVMAGYMNFNSGASELKDAFIFIKQRCVAAEYVYSKCEILNDEKGAKSVMEMLTNTLISVGRKYGVENFIVTIASNNTASINLAQRTAINNGMQIWSPGNFVCQDTVKKDGIDTSENEMYFIMSKDPEAAFYNLRQAGYLQNCQSSRQR